MKDTWYAEGLQFTCVKDCTHCCVTHGDHAYVYLEQDDIRRLADHLGLLSWEFLERYTFREDGYVMLRMDEPECLFLGENGCTVYEARPVQCRTFPFWKENLKSRTLWKKAAEFCPGIGQGPTHSRERIQIQIRSRIVGHGGG
jgi:Fe-S-cluster containining protein